jgi:hypothetical protein
MIRDNFFLPDSHSIAPRSNHEFGETSVSSREHTSSGAKLGQLFVHNLSALERLKHKFDLNADSFHDAFRPFQ